VSLALVHAQFVDLGPVIEISRAPRRRLSPRPYLYAMYGEMVYDLYVLYGLLGGEKRRKSHLNHYGSNRYV